MDAGSECAGSPNSGGSQLEQEQEEQRKYQRQMTLPPPRVRNYGFCDEFMMQRFKVEACKLAEKHQRGTCPFAHPGDSTQRRPPHTYQALLCPEVRAKKECPRLSDCECSHDAFEFWLHPDRFRTSLCDKGERCSRPVCFFAHDAQELRPLPNGLKPAQAATQDNTRRAPTRSSASASRSSCSGSSGGRLPGDVARAFAAASTGGGSPAGTPPRVLAQAHMQHSPLRSHAGESSGSSSAGQQWPVRVLMAHPAAAGMASVLPAGAARGYAVGGDAQGMNFQRGHQEAAYSPQSAIQAAVLPAPLAMSPQGSPGGLQLRGHAAAGGGASGVSAFALPPQHQPPPPPQQQHLQLQALRQQQLQLQALRQQQQQMHAWQPAVALGGVNSSSGSALPAPGGVALLPEVWAQLQQLSVGGSGAVGGSLEGQQLLPVQQHSDGTLPTSVYVAPGSLGPDVWAPAAAAAAASPGHLYLQSTSAQDLAVLGGAMQLPAMPGPAVGAYGAGALGAWGPQLVGAPAAAHGSPASVQQAGGVVSAATLSPARPQAQWGGGIGLLQTASGPLSPVAANPAGIGGVGAPW